MRMYSKNKVFYLETDFISGKSLACHLILSKTTLGSNDSLDSIPHSRILDFDVICFKMYLTCKSFL